MLKFERCKGSERAACMQLLEVFLLCVVIDVQSGKLLQLLEHVSEMLVPVGHLREAAIIGVRVGLLLARLNLRELVRHPTLKLLVSIHESCSVLSVGVGIGTREVTDEL